jgi:D-alanyl-lipoteichoic acid acyltransferase DltB (MBOAT superfamily)
MRPLRSFLLLLIFLACFSGLFYIFPASHLFPEISEFIPEKLLSYLISENKDASVVPYAPPDNSVLSVSADTNTLADTIPSISEDKFNDQLTLVLDSLRQPNGLLRIMYYGDSQIEGDRITSYLRKRLRNSFGGTGPGLFLPLMPVMSTKSLSVRSSSNWERYNFLSYKSGELSHLNMGPLMALCRYLPEGKKTLVPERAFVKIKPPYTADSASSVYDFLRVFYGNTEGEVNITVTTGKDEIISETLKRGGGFNEFKCPLNGTDEVLIEFSGNVSPDIYGISIESEKGIILDNIPQRGSAGLEFTMVNRENLKESYEKLSPGLIILHYGLNIVLNVRGDYSYFQKGLERQLSLLKEIAPATPILVVSLTDMALNEGDSIRSYPNIPIILNSQKQAARIAGVAFWDSYSAMGGKSSIIKWAEMTPPLAQKDFVHFTFRGADTLASKLADAIFSCKVRDSDIMQSALFKPDAVFQAQSLIIPEKEPAGEEKNFEETLLSLLFRYNPDEPLIFSTPAFWFFFLIVLAGYSLIYKKLVLRNFYLFLVSLFFYYKSGGLFLLLLIFVTCIDFTAGLLIHNSKSRFMRRFFIILSIVSNLGILAYFKYTGFFTETINELFGTDYRVNDFLAAFSNSHLGTSFNISSIVLPVGISFFTFQSLSYTFDIYRKRMDPVRNIIDFGFYVSFFPQLVAGPIVRASEFIPQLYTEFRLARPEFSQALFLISKGLIKKVIISDFIATNFIDRVFDSPSLYSGFENLMAVYGYGLQIYCDFSGYTDIAIGLALILGFRLPVNFNSPYKAESIGDFWKRWHISLSRWLKDYLYIPLGGNRKGKFRTGLNLMITMLLGGLWHGAAPGFVIWGFLHGAGLVISRAWNSFFGARVMNGRIGRAIAVFITFQFVSFCWIFFRAPDTNSVGIMINQIAENFSPGSFMTVLPAYNSAFLLIAVGYIFHFLPEKIKEAYRGLFLRSHLIAQLAIIMVIAMLLFHMRTNEVMPFIYFRF